MLPFDDSRRLLGPNLFFAETGAMLESAGIEVDAMLLAAWSQRVADAAATLDWPPARTVIREHASGTQFVLAAPPDQLFTATELNEWALCASLVALGRAGAADLEEALAHAMQVNGTALSEGIGIAPRLERTAAFARLKAFSQRERNPALLTVLAEAERRGLPHLLDDEALTIGYGAGGVTGALHELVEVFAQDWSGLREVPLAVVTGSNGKTTTVRLIAAAMKASGWVTGHCSTDGVTIGGEAVTSGDYSGPAGARRVLRDARVQAAAIEAARGGILRRGLAFDLARVAVVTNISADHFGEYGIHDLEGLADAKLAVARLVDAPDRWLVLNAADPVLRAKGERLVREGWHGSLAWFAEAAAVAEAAALATSGTGWCGVSAGRLILRWEGQPHDLGAVAAMPLTLEGHARYNVANLAGAALACAAVGVSVPVIAGLFSRFGVDAADNPGRLQRIDIGGLALLIDYAHNPDGLGSLLEMARAMPAGNARAGDSPGRLLLLLGHAGNRTLADFEGLAHVAAAAHPALIVLKEIEGYERGRTQGEIPRLLRAALLRAGHEADAILEAPTELDGVKLALAAAREGDLLVLPVHAARARRAVSDLIETLRQEGWRAAPP